MKKLALLASVSVLVILALWGSQTPLAAFSDEEFHQAVEFYKDGKFRQAAGRFESFVEKGFANPAIYYNLGNCYHQLGLRGKAVWAYEKAYRLDPRDPDIRWNLELLRKQRVDQPDAKVLFSPLRWLSRKTEPLRSDELAWAFSAGTAFLALSLAVYGFFGAVRRAVQKWITFGLLLVLVFGIFLGVRWNDIRNPSGIIVDNEVYVRYGPSEDATRAFQLHEGTKVMITRESGDWLFIHFGENQKGWLPKDSLLLL